jgi:putative Mg2+ transporter-C (MgtC) family protein
MYEFNYEMALRLLLSFLIGTAIGFEREYRGKAAGLRTMIMICLGSTIFTEISLLFGGSSPDRIASNIITGIGFLGAGVIFKEGLTISGITTATTIWISSALGMAVGVGEYLIAFTGSIAVLIVLTIFEKAKEHIDHWHQTRSYRIECTKTGEADAVIEAQLKSMQLKFIRTRDMQNREARVLNYQIWGRAKTLDAFNHYLRNQEQVFAYSY